MKAPRASGFTLIELLATIGIIALLSALVLGVTSKITSRAKTVQCTTNLRQLATAFQNYAADNNGGIPAPSGNDLNGTSATWMNVMMSYLGMSMPKIGQKNIFLCPAAMDSFPNHAARRSYGMNAAGTDGKTAFRLAAIPKPSLTLLLVDTVENGSGQGDGVSNFGINNYTGSVDWRHRDSLCALMFDGHVENIRKTDTAQLDTSVRNLIR